MPPLFNYRDKHFESRLWDSARPDDWDVRNYFRVLRTCRYCDGRVARWVQRLTTSDLSTTRWLKLCSSCGWFWLWWTHQYRSDEIWDSERFIEWEYAILERFDLNDADAPLKALARTLASDWTLSKHLSAQRAEDLVAGIFREHCDAEIEYLSDGVHSPDGGIDFVLVTRATGDRIAFQVKRRQTDSRERVQPVREFIGALCMKGFVRGTYVSTAEAFTAYAIREITDGAAALRGRRLRLQLVDGQRLRGLVRCFAEDGDLIPTGLRGWGRIEENWWQPTSALRGGIPSSGGLDLREVVQKSRELGQDQTRHDQAVDDDYWDPDAPLRWDT